MNSSFVLFGEKEAGGCVNTIVVFKERLFWPQCGEHLEEGKNGSRESSERLQWPKQDSMDATLHYGGGGEGKKGIYLRGTYKAKSTGLPVGMDLRAKGDGVCTAGWMVAAFTEKEH